MMMMITLEKVRRQDCHKELIFVELTLTDIEVTSQLEYHNEM